jgi:hypothetical protein
MSPGGHFVTTAAACAVAAAVTHGLPGGESAAIVAGIAAGSFLIDVDHAVDYVLFDRQRDLRPDAFLRYYLEARPRYAVLVLHSYELFALLLAAAWWTRAPWLEGYLLGALMHLALDIAVNGELMPRSIVPFYSFAYRASHGFSALALLGPPRSPAPDGFWHAFFRGSVPPNPTGDVPAATPEPVRVTVSDPRG